jgi:hypothetical protein
MASILQDKFVGPMVWDADSQFLNDGLATLDDACQLEIATVAEELRANPLPTEALQPEDFVMPACKSLMASVRETVDNGTGFAVVDRLDVNGLGRDIATKIYWLLMSMAGRPVAQKWDGTLVYDVLDKGGKATPGSGVRSSTTNGGQGFHNDNAFNLPPDFVALFCLQTAMKGGISGIVSFESVYNKLLDEYHEVLERLYQPFHFDRQMEHAPDEDRVSLKPIFEVEGDALNVNFSPRLVEHGYQMKGEELDLKTRAAIDALCQTTEIDNLCKRFEFQRGQIQIVNNRRLGHRRTAFRDAEEPEDRRHLVRIWVRKSGRPFYQG